MSPRIDISIDELPEASSLLDGHDYSSQIIQRIAGVPVILDASGCPHSLFSKLNMMTGRLGLQVDMIMSILSSWGGSLTTSITIAAAF